MNSVVINKSRRKGVLYPNKNRILLGGGGGSTRAIVALFWLVATVSSSVGFLMQQQQQNYCQGLASRNYHHQQELYSIQLFNELEIFYHHKRHWTCLHVTNKKNNNNEGDNNANKKNETKHNNNHRVKRKEVKDLQKRVLQLERLVSNQAVEIRRIKQECDDLKAAAAAFAQVVELLRQAGLAASSSDVPSPTPPPLEKQPNDKPNLKLDIHPSESEIFGAAPSSVIEAADSAGASVLAAMLAGKLRMLVDVRDAELSHNPDILVQFIELAILPVAAGLEGLHSHRNRVKLVFPTVSQLLLYRRTMALAAPEVVALSTLGFDSVESRDNLVVIIAPSPDDRESISLMLELLEPKDAKKRIEQPVVVLNYHMLPVTGVIAAYDVVYHLRLLSVHYMTGSMDPEYITNIAATNISSSIKPLMNSTKTLKTSNKNSTSFQNRSKSDEDAALEAAMEHAHETGVNQGITRAMVIRAYPRPWHVFVDTSPDIDADFEIAATFDQEPTPDQVNYAIVECLEGSEREDELVAQQMQEALESGQLNRVSEMLGISPRIYNETEDEEEDDDDDDFWFKEDSC